MRIVGLTGGIACGKSFVTSELLEAGIPVLDCDAIARIVVEPGTDCHKQIVNLFRADLQALGENIELPDGTLNRKGLGRIVFADDEKRHKLTRITGNAIFRYLMKQFAWHFIRGTPMVVVDAPTLLESNFLVPFCSSIVVVAVSDELQLERLLLRDVELSREDALNRIKSQMTTAAKVDKATQVIWNDGSRQDTKKRVKEVFGLEMQKSNSLLYRMFSGPGVAAAAVLVAGVYLKSKM